MDLVGGARLAKGCIETSPGFVWRTGCLDGAGDCGGDEVGLYNEAFCQLSSRREGRVVAERDFPSEGSDLDRWNGRILVTPGRFELPTRSLGNCCSIHLSYGATVLIEHGIPAGCPPDHPAGGREVSLPRTQDRLTRPKGRKECVEGAKVIANVVFEDRAAGEAMS